MNFSKTISHQRLVVLSGGPIAILVHTQLREQFVLADGRIPRGQVASEPVAQRIHPSAPCGCPGQVEVTIVRSVQPPSQPPPAGGRSQVPSPGGGGSGREPAPCPRSRGAGVPPALPGRLQRAWCAMRMTVSREHRGTRFPHTPARGRAWPSRRGRGNRVSPYPTRWESLGGLRPPKNYGHPVGVRPEPHARLVRNARRRKNMVRWVRLHL